MKINFGALILNSEKEPFKKAKPNGEADEADLTLKDISEQALLADGQEERALSDSDKAARYKLFNRITDGVDDLKLDEVVLLKKCISKSFSILVRGRAFDIIEPESSLGEKAPD